MKVNLQPLFEKPMSRREFLKYVGAVLLSLIGVSRLMKALTHEQTSSQRSAGYGGGTYGGNKLLH